MTCPTIRPSCSATKDKGLSVTEIDKADFLANVQKNVTFEQFGYRKADWDRIQAIR